MMKSSSDGDWRQLIRGLSVLAPRALLALLAVGFPTAFAAQTIIFNESAAFECYQAALHDGDRFDIETCTMAIEHQALGLRDRAATHSNRGLLYARIGDLREALRDHDRAVKMAPELASVYINRSNALVRANRFTPAMRDLEKAIDLADESLAYAHYNRALLFQRLGDHKAARADAEIAAEIAPESKDYQAYLRRLQPEQSELPGAVPVPEEAPEQLPESVSEGLKSDQG
jgi:tetratricopeptide (TPR) repeat protein